MAKKNTRDTERRAIAEQMRKQQASKERRRSLLILGACIVVVLGLLAAALVPYLKQRNEDAKAAGTPITKLGVTTTAAKCEPVKKAKATGNNNHISPGTKIPYADAPPSSGPHWGNFLQGTELRSMYTVGDRPEVERLVHSLEHGHTILWYDDTVKPGSTSYKSIKAIAAKFDAVDDKFMAAPWESADGKAFPRRHARRPDPLDRPRGPAGHHAVLRSPQRRGRQDVHGRLPQDQRPRAQRGLTSGLTGGRCDPPRGGGPRPTSPAGRGRTS